MKKYLILLLLFIQNVSYCQDFYINQKYEAEYLNYSISPQWENLNLNEAYDFLQSSGFSSIKTTNNNGKETVYGIIAGGEYIFIRRLVFKNNVILEYSDGVEFIQPCVLCLAKSIKESLKNNLTMQQIANDGVTQAIKNDTVLKDVFFNNYVKSLNKDGIKSPLIGDICDSGFTLSHSINTDKHEIDRFTILKLNQDNIYNFYSERKVTLNDEDYLVGNFNLKEINQYDLKLMVDVFLLDCKINNIITKQGETITTFETLDGNTLGLSYGINNDAKIELKIDPEKWANSSIPKRWYLIYHELGHDVLNLQHGNGGKMMFNFADKGYSWKEFWEDKQYMFQSYKSYKK